MSLDMEARLRTFFASAPQRQRSVKTLEISHSAMSQTYHLWRESLLAPRTTTETGLVVQMELANFDISLAGTAVNLDQQYTIKIDTTDINDEFRMEMDAIPIDTNEKVGVVYREYLSDDLTDPQTVARLQLESISYQKGAASLSVVSPRLNVQTTGETYNPRDIQMLRGFV